LALKIEMNLSAEKVDLLNEICAPLAEELGVPNLRLFASSGDLRAKLKEFTKEWPAQDVSVKTKLTLAQPLKTVPKVCCCSLRSPDCRCPLQYFVYVSKPNIYKY
jgi:hypothetical protein